MGHAVQDVGRLWSDRAAMVSSQAKTAGRDRSGTAGPLVARSPRVRPLASWWQQVPRHGLDCRPRMGCAGTIPTPPGAMASGITARNRTDRPSQLAPERPSQDCHPGSLAFGSNERWVTRPVARNQRAVCPHGQGFVSRRDERVGIGRQNHAHRRRAQKKLASISKVIFRCILQRIDFSNGRCGITDHDNRFRAGLLGHV